VPTADEPCSERRRAASACRYVPRKGQTVAGVAAAPWMTTNLLKLILCERSGLLHGEFDAARRMVPNVRANTTAAIAGRSAATRVCCVSCVDIADRVLFPATEKRPRRRSDGLINVGPWTAHAARVRGNLRLFVLQIFSRRVLNVTDSRDSIAIFIDVWNGCRVRVRLSVTNTRAASRCTWLQYDPGRPRVLEVLPAAD
jgi:hypothetical protein